MLEAVLAGTRDWLRALRAGKGPALREALALLVERVVPERVGHNRYQLHIQYSNIGLALLEEAASRGAKVVRLVPSQDVGVDHHVETRWSTLTPGAPLSATTTVTLTPLSDTFFAIDGDGVVALPWAAGL